MLYVKKKSIIINNKKRNVYTKQGSTMLYIIYKRKYIRLKKYRTLIKGGSGGPMRKPLSDIRYNPYKKFDNNCGYIGHKRAGKLLYKFAEYWYDIKNKEVSYSRDLNGYFLSFKDKKEQHRGTHIRDCSDIKNHIHIFYMEITDDNKIVIGFTMKINGKATNSLSLDASVPGKSRNEQKKFQILESDSSDNDVFERIYNFLQKEFTFSEEMNVKSKL